MDISKAFGQVIREERKKIKMTQAKLAELSELENNTIGLYERGINQPSLKAIFKMAKALNVEPDYLVRRVKEVLDRDKG